MGVERAAIASGVRQAAVLACGLLVLGTVGCAPATPSEPSRRAEVAPELTRLPPSAEGIAFVRGGAAFVIRDGSLREVAPDGAPKVAVGYSADRKGLLVTEEHAERRVVLLVTEADKTSESVVMDTAAGSALGAVRMVPQTERLYYSVFGEPANLLRFRALDPASEVATVALSGPFSGDFDVDATGKAVVYTGSGQNPATVMVRTGTSDQVLVAGFATAFSPAFSRDGKWVCFTGSESARGPIAVWTVDRAGGKPRVVPGTGGLSPTFPVFSPDGSHIACRSGDDGSIWVIPTADGEPQKVAVGSDEAPIGW